MLERRTTIRTPGTARDPAVLPVPDEDDQAVPVRTVPDGGPVPVLALPGQPSGPDQPTGQPEVRPAAALLDFACRIAAEYQDSHGQPITRDTLRARLGVSNQLASDLLRQIRTTPETT